MKDNEYVAQEYVMNPYLIDEKKFDLRLYLLIKGVDVMEGYIAFEGMARFWTENYKPPTRSTDEQKATGDAQEILMSHLTNFTLNKASVKFVNNNDFKANDNGSKRLLSTIFKILDRQGANVEEIKEEVKDISTKIVLALQPFLVNSFHSEMGITGESNQNCFHLFGLDILLDEDLKWWVMEINWFPSFSYFYDKIEIDPVDESEKQVKVIAEFDKYLKPLIIKDTLDIVRTGKVSEDSTFIQVFPPPECQEYYK